MVIEKALKGLRIRSHINDCDAGITKFCSEDFNRLTAVGDGNSKTENLKQTVKQMMQTAYQIKLKEEMPKCIDLNKPMRKDIRKYIARLSVETANYQAYAIQR